MKCYLCKSEYDPYEIVAYFQRIPKKLDGTIMDERFQETRTLCKKCMTAFVAGLSVRNPHILVDWWPRNEASDN